MQLTKKHKKIWTIITVIASISILLSALIPLFYAF